MEIRKLQKHGNSLSINIPPAFVTTLQLHAGDYVELALTVDQGMTIFKCKPKPTGSKQCETS